MLDISTQEFADRADCGYLCLALDGRIIRINSTLLGWLGQTDAKLHGPAGLHDVLMAGALESEAFLAAVCHHAYLGNVRLDLRCADGQVLPVLVNAVLRRADAQHGDYLSLSLFKSDESRAGRPQRHTNPSMPMAQLVEERVLARTSQLADNLQRAQLEAHRQTNALHQVSFHVRSPLHAILGMTELLLSGEARPDQRVSLEAIRTAGQAMLDVFDALTGKTGPVDASPRPRSAGPLFQVHPAPPAARYACLDQAIREYRPRLHGTRILLAEDNPLNQELARQFLERVGVVVTIVNDGAAAVHAIGQQHFDCVLMDVHMPVMDGIEAVRILRAQAATRHLPVLALTANALSSDRQRCLAAGMDDFLPKPIDGQTLYATLAKRLNLAVPAPTVPAADPDTHLSPALISLALLAELVDNDEDTMQRLLHIFLDNANNSIGEMQAALAAHDMEALRRLGHRMKSSARAVGALRLASLAARLEMGPDDYAQAMRVVAEMPPLVASMREQVAQLYPEHFARQAGGAA